MWIVVFIIINIMSDNFIWLYYNGTKLMSQVLVLVLTSISIFSSLVLVHRFIFKFWIKDLVLCIGSDFVSVLVQIWFRCWFRFYISKIWIRFWLMVENPAQKSSWDPVWKMHSYPQPLYYYHRSLFHIKEDEHHQCFKQTFVTCGVPVGSISAALSCLVYNWD